MTREKIEDIRFIVIPFVANILKGINYEGQGDSDAKEFIDDFNVIFDLAIKALEQEPRWIPASERLPEKTGIYLISIGDLVASKSFDGHNFRTESAVRFIPDAWMPLPEPFEPQESEG
ncbi:MAG: hypothetical protein IKE94_11055 [Aeriscardovia sp.]|nr:hypothetical protein [Aeriscardovia sp.]